jgi:hypothetical protein
MAATTGTNTAGLLIWTVGITIAIWLFQIFDRWLAPGKTEKRITGLGKAIRQSVRGGFFTFAAIALVVFLSWIVFVARTVYFDHTGLRYANSAQLMKSGQSSAADAQEIARLKAEVEFQQNNITTQEPVFINIRDLLQSFAVFRSDLNKESCFVKITAPHETEPLARVMGSFSTATSNCPTFGPMLGNIDPDETEATMRGMVSDAIVFHAARDDKAANTLAMNLGNRIKLVRSYDLPKTDYQIPLGGYQHTVWLQFGDKVKWNSELH